MCTIQRNVEHSLAHFRAESCPHKFPKSGQETQYHGLQNGLPSGRKISV